MYQTIGEDIEVIGIYKKNLFQPVKFQWQGRTYTIDRITQIAEFRDGGVKQRMYSVMSKGNVYRLVFNRDSENWRLEEIWME